ncbi:MAG: murein L,D-transpeptidase [Chitinophagales bacterium]|jgi:murein L,D-transpeptidase YcbB/YkuD|nr:L,D-transpeptidase family protein [Sphingobacteriales bacterium]
MFSFFKFDQVITYLKLHFNYIGGASLIVFVIVIFAFKKCNAAEIKPIMNEDVCLNLSKNYSDFILDSLVIENYFLLSNSDDSIRSQVREFYHARAHQFAWFNPCGLATAASTFNELMKNYQSESGTNRIKHTVLDSLLTNALNDENKFLKNWNQVSWLEYLLTESFFQYAPKMYSGSTENLRDLSWFIPRRKKNYSALLDSLISSTNQNQFIEPLNPYYIKLKKKLVEFKRIDKEGTYPLSVFDSLNLRVGDTDRGISILKKQLFILDDWKETDESAIYTSALRDAVMYFQMRMGLVQTGIIDKKTITELNTPVKDRIKQILLNLERLRWVPSTMPQNFFLVNIPEYKLHVIENGKPLFDMNVIVGKTMHKTVIFEEKISSVVLNPYWNIPKSIVENEIRKHMNRDRNYLSRNNMEIVTNGNEIVYRQKPGDKNALGKIKFLFPNHYNIYLHDAPAKSLFKVNERAFSHGCIRVAEARKLVLYILNKQETWSVEKLDAILATNKEKHIAISPAMPVFIAYFTSWVDHKGALHFRNDIYGLDKRLELEIFGE